MKNFRNLRVVIIVTGILLASCIKSDPVSQETTTPTVPIQESFLAPTPTENGAGNVGTSTPSKPDVPTRTLYTFDADLDYNKHTLQVRETIRYRNLTGSDLDTLVLVVSPNHEPNVFLYQSILVTGEAALQEQTLSGVKWEITLKKPLRIGEEATLQIEYLLDIPRAGGVLGYTDRQTNLSDWYPYIPPFDPDNGWVIHEPSEVGEYLVYDTADFELTLSGTDGLQVAASALVIPSVVNVKMRAANARNLTFSISDSYINLTTKSGQTRIDAYVFPGDETSGQAALEYTRLALETFSDLYGAPYLRDTMTLVEADFADGMEYDGLYYLSRDYFARFDGGVTNYLALLSVHETAHQWWYALVANDQALEPWLDEALCTYSELLFLEYNFPDLTDWWWEYRVETYTPSGKVDSTIYDHASFRPYVNSVYLQGAKFLHGLRKILGDDAFFTGLRSYASRNRSQIADWNGFLEIMIPVPNEASTALVREYF